MNALQQSQNTLHLYLAGPDCAAGYRPQDLSAADRALLAAHPTRGGSTDWQVSRFLKQQAGAVSSLSHSRGHAALALAHGFAVGIDLEALRPRRFAHWREWILHADECRWLEENGADISNHYLLWTLKEALLKAAGLVLADMAAVGLRRSDNGVWQLHANGGKCRYTGRDSAAGGSRHTGSWRHSVTQADSNQAAAVFRLLCAALAAMPSQNTFQAAECVSGSLKNRSNAFWA